MYAVASLVGDHEPGGRNRIAQGVSPGNWRENPRILSRLDRAPFDVALD